MLVQAPSVSEGMPQLTADAAQESVDKKKSLIPQRRRLYLPWDSVVIV